MRCDYKGKLRNVMSLFGIPQTQGMLRLTAFSAKSVSSKRKELQIRISCNVGNGIEVSRMI